jgi:ferredoxin
VNVAGVLSPEDYDARVDEAWRTARVLPDARAVVLLASGGKSFFRAAQGAPEWGRGDHPLDAFLARIVREAVAAEQRAGYAADAALYFERRDGRYADFMGLGHACGLGAPSRLAVLVHPEFGPWIALRALLFTQRALAPTPADPDFDPCRGCPAPCAEACPAAALSRPRFDLVACREGSARLPDCQVGCAARRACVVGPEHRYDADAEAWHRRVTLGAPRGGSR